MLSFPEISKRKSEKEIEIEHEREGLGRERETRRERKEERERDRKNRGNKPFKVCLLFRKTERRIEAVSAWQERRKEEARCRGRKTTSHSA